MSLLAIGYLGIVQQRDEAAAAVLETLIDQAPGEPGQAAVLAGEAVADAESGGVTPTARERVVQVLLSTLRDDEHVKPSRRAEACQVLATCGDPRFRDDAWHLSEEPLLGFVEVPEGPFRMGTPAEDIPALMEHLGGERKGYEMGVTSRARLQVIENA